ncbi:hypothetical protein ILUMI_16727 [Ignelater luminosus]|uniref:PiggyBac transposable element-derived protein domain-containing protein n=1 Tax=Ignelater luminosus TaxID=2038154 RepID=A0A8K0CPQ1_IGNLU|nr:hypothetical protein ILUMI_16727 [Ignelater luminosus]
METADVFITPPKDGWDSEEDSGNEGEEGNSKTGTIRSGEIIHEEEDNIPLSELQEKVNNKNVINRAWEKSIDLPQSFASFVSPKQPQNIPSDPVADDKVRSLFDLLNSYRYLKFAEFSEQLSTDESRVPYFGRHFTKHLIRYGSKIWSLCEPFGYLMQLEPYQIQAYLQLYGTSAVGGGKPKTPKEIDNNVPDAVRYDLICILFESSLTMPRPRRPNLSRQSRNARRIRNIANERTEEEQEIAREERRVSMARLRASQSQEQVE